MDNVIEIDFVEEKEKRRKKENDKTRCEMCGEPLSKKEKKLGICWHCFDETTGRG